MSLFAVEVLMLTLQDEPVEQTARRTPVDWSEMLSTQAVDPMSTLVNACSIVVVEPAGGSARYRLTSGVAGVTAAVAAPGPQP